MTVLRFAALAVVAGSLAFPVLADNPHNNKCEGLPTAAQLRTLLGQAPGVSAAPIGGMVGGLFGGTKMWASVVNRDGTICATNTSTTDQTQVWPGSQAIAKAKAFTANAFSIDSLALSTAQLYTFTQPGHSLWSLGQSNLWNPELTAEATAQNAGQGQVGGGMIFFGGGVPLYSNGKIIGALGVSGDTSCADHEIAKRVRHLAGLDPTAGPLADDISYSSADGASAFTHPLCLNTYRNGVSLGTEKAAIGY